MASVSNEITFDFKKKAHQWCNQYLGGSWRNISIDDFSIQVLGGGLSNKLYICSLPESYGVGKEERRKVVLRIYGPLYDELVTSIGCLIADSVVFALLSEWNIGPKLFAIFPEGRLEELLMAKSLAREDLAKPELSVRIAQKTAEYHQLQLPLCKDPDYLWNTISEWSKEALQTHFNEQDKAVKLAKLKSIDLKKEYDFLRNYLEMATSPGPVTFCHNDLQQGNILRVSKELQENNEEDFDLKLIDFEFSAYNYRAFDLANHFCEWMFDYSVPPPQYFSMSLKSWPSKEQQLIFIRAYLGKDTKENNYTSAECTIEESELLDQVNRIMAWHDSKLIIIARKS
ncbi:choline kinase alpha-like isoform X2 [Pocillopora damicornis]|uniref:choline kinase alpha-like isoform X2 n=1 Tax=Pocillopora damicornis TaxID=46731 RepID=UPI000F54CCAB|nr:choline kinase alpha-like isoform X2 [Pocillopora damicornis]